MKKLSFFYLLFILSSTYAYSQTWVERIGRIVGSGDITIEYTVITHDQWYRLKEQYEKTNRFCRISYTDVLEIRNNPIVSGTRPVLDGPPYTLLAIKRGQLTESRSGTILIRGNTATGIMELEYYNSMFMMSGDVEVNSQEYWRRYVMFYDWSSGGYGP